uniref:Gustatory receptor n=1 Tax=Anopheles culicifacies TaxID=139723 RepID=A0A182M8G3_9DIPT
MYKDHILEQIPEEKTALRISQSSPAVPGERSEWDSSLGPVRSKTDAAISSATELLQLSMSLAQYYVGTILIYQLQQKINHQIGMGKSSINLEKAKHLYLQLDNCVELITRSFEFLLVTTVFAGINVSSLQVLEIYQYLHTGDSKPIFIAYNMIWMLLQICMLLMILYPNDKIKREQTRFGTILFELSRQNEAEMVEMTRLRLLTLGRKKVVSTACGVLRLELSTLSSIFVALLSFMIILIQFDSAKLNKNSGAVTAIDSLYSTHS